MGYDLHGSPRGEYFGEELGLTVKEQRFLNALILKELGFTDEFNWELYLKAGFSAKNGNSARANASKLKNSDKIQKRMSTFREQLKERIGDDKVSKRLKQIILKGADRESLNGIKEYNKVLGNYAPKDYNVDFNRDRNDIFEGHVIEDDEDEEIEDDENEMIED